MLFGVVSAVGQGMGVLFGGGDCRGSFGVNFGHPIVTNETLLYSYAKVREPIEMLFEVVSRVGWGIRVLDGGPRGRGGFGEYSPPLF